MNSSHARNKERSLSLSGWARKCVAALACTATGSACAGGAAVSSVGATSGLVITSFAVPVGVPVTTLNVPGVLYAYSQASGSCACAHCRCGESAASPRESTVTTQDVESPGAQVLRQRCARCHTGQEAKEHVQLFDDDGAPSAGWREHTQAMFEAIIERRMPKGGELSAEEKVQLIEWLLNASDEE